MARRLLAGFATICLMMLFFFTLADFLRGLCCICP